MFCDAGDGMSPGMPCVDAFVPSTTEAAGQLFAFLRHPDSSASESLLESFEFLGAQEPQQLGRMCSIVGVFTRAWQRLFF